MHNPPKVHFVIANGEHARCVERGETDFQTVHEMKAHGHHHAKSQTATVHQSGSSVQHAAGEADIKGRRKADFARDLAEHINAEVAAKSYQRLALVAPARILGEVRPHLSQAARDCLVREIDKDLTHTADHDLGKWLIHPDLA